jgi:hypothetical protein
MNADTERRLAAMIEEEAAVLRKQADRDGVAAYLAKPVVKARPNRQFLSAMVRSVEQCLLRSPSFLPFFLILWTLAAMPYVSIPT